MNCPMCMGKNIISTDRFGCPVHCPYCYGQGIVHCCEGDVMQVAPRPEDKKATYPKDDTP